MITNRAALCRRRPTADFQQRTETLASLVFEFLKEITECKVRDLFSPQGFHAAKVQIFKEQNIKLLTQLNSKFPMVTGSL